jgi:hypothetical protein
VTLAALLTLFSILLAVLSLARPVGRRSLTLFVPVWRLIAAIVLIYSAINLPRCSIWCESTFWLVTLLRDLRSYRWGFCDPGSDRTVGFGFLVSGEANG